MDNVQMKAILWKKDRKMKERKEKIKKCTGHFDFFEI